MHTEGRIEEMTLIRTDAFEEALTKRDRVEQDRQRKRSGQRRQETRSREDAAYAAYRSLIEKAKA